MKQLILEAMQAELPQETNNETGLLLSGAVGSTLTGLDHDASDVDRMAVYAYSPDATMRALVGPNNTKEAFFHSDPDVFGYEAVKITSLLMKSNPPVLNFLHSESFEHTTDAGLELVELTKSSLFTMDALHRVFPASAQASYKESTVFASKLDVPITNETLVSNTHKNVARKLKVAFVLLHQVRQALESGIYKTKIDNRSWFLDTYPAIPYMDAVALFEKEFAQLKDNTSSVASFKPIFNDKDVGALRDWVLRAKKSVA